MLRRTGILICFLLALTSVMSGCVPEFKTDKAQQCSNLKTDGDESDIDCGGSCNPCITGKACKLDADCATSTCISGRCYDPSCRDYKQNNTETDVDCGGLCPACKASKHCALNSDCVDGNPCLEGTCYNAGCSDGKRNNGETDVDCGGDQCPACALLKGCKQGSDCKTNTLCLDNLTRAPIEHGEERCGDAGLCSSSGTCYVSTCKNANQDGTETDLDCGGEACPACDTGKTCTQNSDCITGNLCLNKVCYIGTCANGKQDGTETDKDCGGLQCPVCTKGKSCIAPSDCEANTPCTNGKCGDPLCFNKQQDPIESDVDCGGSCTPCGITRKCTKHDDCETLNCSEGVCARSTCSDKSKNQGESDVDCGDATNFCDPCAAGATCTANTNCESKHCVGGYCAAATCDDGIINGKETATDCGGGCPKRCGTDSPCIQPSDCVDNVCKGGFCKAPTCSDGVPNGKETGSDCGGSCLPQTCGNGQPCNTNIDCTFGNCAAGVCQLPTCANFLFDKENETDLDCGGGCPACADTLNCLTDVDCQSKVCDSVTKKCLPPNCSDRAQNGNETDVNCGGVTCTQRCNTGQKCVANSDCLSRVCDGTTGKCRSPECDDTQMNGSETGPDCGGSCALMSLPTPKTCGTGLGCNVDDDCTSNNCCRAASCGAAINTCVAPGCHDGKKNQGESGIDCGGDAATIGCEKRCPPDQTCQYDSDCDSRVCDPIKKTCNAPTCEDKVKNGTEIGQDCGSAACSKPCPDGTPCTGPGDCTSGVCALDSTTNAVTCAVPKCDDKVQNGTESALDCGGNCPARCGLGQACRDITDCDPAVANVECINLKCLVPTCKDGALGSDETDVDCGGSCDKCTDTKKCKVDADCISNHCDSTLHCAAPTCEDQRQNQGESGQDCGGTSPCAKCDTGFGCTQKTDCINLVCGPNNLCLAPTCSDGVLNQDESDLDCGGPNCRDTKPCDSDVGKRCVVHADCKDQWCTTPTGVTGTVCVTPVCGDGKQNGTETDLDCGGNCTTKCADTKGCLKDSDCVNGWCNGSGKCAMPACTDLIRNGTETGPDCGGNCAASCSTKYDSNCKQCSDSSGCERNTDCKSFNCVGGVCAAPSGTTAAACVGKVLDGTVANCNLCSTTPNINAQYCRDYLWCIQAQVPDCSDPGKVNTNGSVTYRNCTDGSANAPCSVNTMHKDTTALDAAIKAYRCACPGG